MGMPLYLAPIETPLTIEKVDVADEKVSGRLMELGILPHSEIEVLLRDRKGGSVVLVKGSRLALDREISRLIFVA